MTDLVERLRTEAHETKIGGPTWGDGEVMHEAADCIETQRAEITRLREEVEAQKEIVAVVLLMHENGKARIKELEAAHQRVAEQCGPYSNATVRRMAGISLAALRSRTEGEG